MDAEILQCLMDIKDALEILRYIPAFLGLLFGAVLSLHYWRTGL